jgi:hypothetical protein
MNARTLPSADYATASALDVVDNFVDTEVAAIKAKTDLISGATLVIADIPTAGAIADEVRVELATELARMDVAVGTRLAAADYIAPSNSSISDIKAKTDQMVFTVPNQIDANALTGGLTGQDIRDSVGLGSANLDDQLAAMPADVWANPSRTITSGGLTPQDVQDAMTAQGYTEGRAPNLDNLDEPISSRSTVTAVEIREEMDANSARLLLAEKILRNKLITDPVLGTITIYDDDGATPLLSAALWEDADGTQPYRRQGSERRDRLT